MAVLLVLDRARDEQRHDVAAHEEKQKEETAINEPDRPRHEDHEAVDHHLGAGQIDQEEPRHRRDRRSGEDAADGPEVEIAKHHSIDLQPEQSGDADREGRGGRGQQRRIARQRELAEPGPEGGDERQRHGRQIVGEQDRPLADAARARNPPYEIQDHGRHS
jgi:hypothetical protein